MSQKSDPKLRVAPRPKQPESTMAFPVNDPLPPETAHFPGTSEKLTEALKKQLSQCTLKVNDSGVTSFETFVNNIRKVGKITLGSMTVFVAKTKSMRFLIYPCPPEELYELTQSMMSVELKKRMILSSPAGKSLFVSAVSGKDYSAFISICSNLSTNGFKESMVPDVNHSLPNMAELIRKLKKAKDIDTPLLIFDMDTFADGLKWSIVMSDESNHAYHELTIGEEEKTYRLYVNSAPVVPASFECVAKFKFNDERCLLYEEK